MCDKLTGSWNFKVAYLLNWEEIFVPQFQFSRQTNYKFDYQFSESSAFHIGDVYVSHKSQYR